MDNICHTLVGAVCGEAGLKHRTRLASTTLMIAANLPDVDVAVFLTDVPSVAFRRGVTHGVLAQALLPPLLALGLFLVARRRQAGNGPPLHLGWLVALAYVGVFSHVGLDLLNNYGVRLLMPLSGQWFYGDTLFIVDPWLWAVLGAGVWWARRSMTARPARHAIVVAALYIALMVVGARTARQVVTETWHQAHGTEPAALMVGPRPVTPFTRDVIVDAGDHYETGTFSWFTSTVVFAPDVVAKNDRLGVVAVARREPEVAGFLVWSRFPAWTVTPGADGVAVRVGDMRFGAVRRLLGGRGFEAQVTVPSGAVD